MAGAAGRDVPGGWVTGRPILRPSLLRIRCGGRSSTSDSTGPSTSPGSSSGIVELGGLRRWNGQFDEWKLIEVRRGYGSGVLLLLPMAGQARHLRLSHPDCRATGGPLGSVLRTILPLRSVLPGSQSHSDMAGAPSAAYCVTVVRRPGFPRAVRWSPSRAPQPR